MYTLRSITRDGHQNNMALGSHYSYVSRKYAKEAFERVYKNAYDSKEMDSETVPNINCVGMIQSENIDFIFLWNEEENYIMTESGKTFSNLTFK